MDLPQCAKGPGVDSVAEFNAFVAATGAAASHALALLTELHNAGGRDAIPTADSRSTSARGLYCKQVAGWAVFYTAGMVKGRFRAMVLYVASMDVSSFADLESEAVRRMAMMEKEA